MEGGVEEKGSLGEASSKCRGGNATTKCQISGLG